MKASKNAKLYKGVHVPTCNGGHPCEACLAVWRNKNPKKPRQKFRVGDTVVDKVTGAEFCIGRVH